MVILQKEPLFCLELIPLLRKATGYNTSEQLTQFISEKTGVHFGRDYFWRIERDKVKGPICANKAEAIAQVLNIPVYLIRHIGRLSGGKNFVPPASPREVDRNLAAWFVKRPLHRSNEGRAAR